MSVEYLTAQIRTVDGDKWKTGDRVCILSVDRRPVPCDGYFSEQYASGHDNRYGRAEYAEFLKRCRIYGRDVRTELLARGYYEKGKAFSMALAANANNANAGMEENQAEAGADPAALFNVHTTVVDYGMTGEVKLITYTRIEL